jgi:hypothetical protein
VQIVTAEVTRPGIRDEAILFQLLSPPTRSAPDRLTWIPFVARLAAVERTSGHPRRSANFARGHGDAVSQEHTASIFRRVEQHKHVTGEN